MSHRFPPLRPPVAAARKATFRPALADLCLLTALVLSLGLALI